MVGGWGGTVTLKVGVAQVLALNVGVASVQGTEPLGRIHPGGFLGDGHNTQQRRFRKRNVHVKSLNLKMRGSAAFRKVLL